MVVMGNARTMAKAAGAATAAAPYVRAIVQDEELRDSLKELVGSVNHLYGSVSGRDGLRKLATDDAVREDVDRIVASLQEGVRRLTQDARPRRHWGRWIACAVGFGGAIGALLMYWRGGRGRPAL